MTSRCSAPRATTRCGTRAAQLAQRSGLHEARIEPAQPLRPLAHEVLALVQTDPTLASRSPARRTTARRAVYAASHEGARHLDEILARRTRISIETFDRGIGAADEVARLVGAGAGVERRAGARGRSSTTVKRVEAERESQRMPDDETADAARMGAPEIVPCADRGAGMPAPDPEMNVSAVRSWPNALTSSRANAHELSVPSCHTPCHDRPSPAAATAAC